MKGLSVKLEVRQLLHYRVIGEGRPLVIVHGLFGSGDNWLTLAGKFPGRRVYLPDLRNHGDSFWDPSFTVADLAGDLAEMARLAGLGPCPWIGHSLGGKAVMELVLSEPDLATGAAILDMAPRASEARYLGFVPALRALDLSLVASRGEAQKLLEKTIQDRPTLQFLLKSLTADGENTGRLRWKLNLEALDNQYPEIWRAIRPGRSWAGPILFLKGGDSDYFQPGNEVFARELFPKAELATIPEAGHWLHAEKPAEVMAALKHWLEKIP